MFICIFEFLFSPFLLQNFTFFGNSRKLYWYHSSREKAIFCEFILPTEYQLFQPYYYIWSLHTNQLNSLYSGICHITIKYFILKVMDTRTADCTVTEHPQLCPLESRNTENCTSYNWTGSVEVSSATIRNSLIRVSTDEVILDHINLTESNFSVPILIR